MKQYLLFLLTLLPLLCQAQQFELKQPDSKKIQSEIKNSNYRDEETFVYLKLNYKPTGKPTGVKKDVEFENQPVCSFTQKFEGGIIYFIDSCGEGKGTTVLLTLPKTDTATLKKWIEKMYNANGTEIKNVWDKTGLIYQPEDEGAGCYYEIKQSKNKTEVEMYCGC